MAVGSVGGRAPGTPGPGGFVPWSAGMNLQDMYAQMSGVERMQALLSQAFRDYLGAQPVNMALLGRAGVSAPQARGIGGMNLQSQRPSYGAAPLAGSLAENRLQQDMWAKMLDRYQIEAAQAAQGGGLMDSLGSLLPIAGMALGGLGLPGVASGPLAGYGIGGAMVGSSAGSLLGQILGGRY